jgi:rhodanese-related sulfurtransferase
MLLGPALGLVLGLGLAAALPGRSPSANFDLLARDIDRESDHVAAVEVAQWIHDKRPGLRVIDLRSDSEYTAEHIPTAEHMTVAQLAHAGFRRDETIVLYSAGGGHAAQGWILLRAAGLEHVYDLRGGMDEWGGRARAVWRGGC